MHAELLDRASCLTKALIALSGKLDIERHSLRYSLYILHLPKVNRVHVYAKML